MRRLGLTDLFHPSGRINRMDFFTGGALLAIAAVSLEFGINTLLGMAREIPASVMIAAQLLIVVPLIYGQFCVTAKRLHDINIPAVVAITGFVGSIFGLYLSFTPPAYIPAAIAQNVSRIDVILMAIVIIFNLILLFVPGTDGENRYGRRTVADPRPQATSLEG